MTAAPPRLKAEKLLPAGATRWGRAGRNWFGRPVDHRPGWLSGCKLMGWPDFILHPVRPRPSRGSRLERLGRRPDRMARGMLGRAFGRAGDPGFPLWAPVRGSAFPRGSDVHDGDRFGR